MLDLMAKCAVAMSAAANDEIKSSKKVIVTEVQSVAERMRTQNKAAFRASMVLWGEICIVGFPQHIYPKVQDGNLALIRWTSQRSPMEIKAAFAARLVSPEYATRGHDWVDRRKSLGGDRA
jgi:hypothetical protein